MRLFFFVLLLAFLFGCFMYVSGSNVCIDDVGYGSDDSGKKFIEVIVKNYDGGNAAAQGFLHLNINCSGQSLNFTQNFSVNKTKSVVFYFEFCECDAYASLDVENNFCIKKEKKKKLGSVSVNFYEKSTLLSGTIYDIYKPVNTDFQIKNIKTGGIYSGKTLYGNFSINLEEIGEYEIFFKYCNITKNFQTKHEFKISATDASEDEPMRVYVSDENNNPIPWINIKCSGELCASTDVYGTARIYPETDFNLSIDETEFNWGNSKFIKVKVKPALIIETYPKENISAGNIVLFVKSSGKPVSESFINITKPDGKTENLTVGMTGSANFYADLAGNYIAKAFKDSYKEAFLEFTVRKNFVMEINPKEPEINETVYVKISDGNLTLSNVIILIKSPDGENKTGKTDIDGEISFRLLNETYTVCASKENYFPVCREISTLKDLELDLSKNFIVEKYYDVFSKVEGVVSNKDIPIIANIVVNTPKGRNENFFASSFSAYLNETGKYTVNVKRAGYKEISSEFYAEKLKVEILGMGVDNHLMFLNWSSPNVGKIFVEKDGRVFEVLSYNGTSKFSADEGDYKIYLDDRYKFEGKNFRIKKVYDNAWLYMALIMILLITILMVFQEKYKKKHKEKPETINDTK